MAENYIDRIKRGDTEYSIHDTELRKTVEDNKTELKKEIDAAAGKLSALLASAPEDLDTFLEAANEISAIKESKLDKTEAETKYQPAGSYISSETFETRKTEVDGKIGIINTTLNNKLDSTVAAETYQEKGDYALADDIINENLLVNFNLAKAEEVADAAEADTVVEGDIFEESEEEVIKKLQSDDYSYVALVDEDGNRYPLLSKKTTNSGKFKVKFTGATSSKKLIKIELNTLANDFTHFNREKSGEIDIGDNELLAIKYLYNYDADKKSYDKNDPVIYTNKYTYSKDEIDGKGFLTEHQSLVDYALKTELPTKISELENDAGYLTENQSLEGYATEEYVNNKVASVYRPKESVESFDALPLEGNAEGDVRNVNDTGMNYVWTGTTWDALGTSVDLTGYAKTADIDTKLEEYAKKSDIPAETQVPTKLSDLENDTAFITSAALESYALKSEIPAVPTKVSELENDSNFLTEHQSLADYALKSEIPSTANLASKDVETRVPELPADSEDGTYVLKAVKADGVIAYQWVKE